jgi:hypothetical protein
MRQDLVLQTLLHLPLGPHPRGRLDIRTPVFAGDDKLALEAEFRVGDDLFDLGRGVSCRFGQDELALRLDLRGELGVFACD